MRFHVVALTTTVLASSVLAGCQDRACGRPPHCLASAIVEGSCLCTEWEVIESQRVDLPSLVAAVVYPLAGDGSSVQYGGRFTDDLLGDFTLSPIGARWRVRVRGGDGVEQTARAHVEVPASGGWRLQEVTRGTVAFSSVATLGHSARVDLPTHAEDDLVAVWVNPRATVETDFSGGRTVRWAAGPMRAGCGPGPIQVAWLTPGQLLGAAAPTDACSASLLASLDTAQRAALAAHDVFFSPVGGDPQAIFAREQYETFENTTVRHGLTRTAVWRWACQAMPADDDLPAYFRTEVPLADGEALAVEHTFLATGAACEPSSLAVIESTGTADCAVATALELDLAFGTAFHMAGTQWDWSGTAACTR